ncbi:MAG: hypothetical protein ACRDNF_00180 [Streptosporangiaceae bacterium]
MADARSAGPAPGAEWWRALPPAGTEIPCGSGRHQVRWAEGRLSVPAHADAEAELVLAALGGEKTACTGLAGMWAQHADDLDVLALGPRSAADQPDLTWDDVEMVRSTTPTGSLLARVSGSVSSVYRRRSGGVSGVSPAARAVASVRQELAAARERRLDLLTLFALGPAFRMRLSGSVAAAWAGAGRGGDRAAHRPELAAALTGRLGLAVQSWLSFEPWRVTASLHEGPGWGSLEPSGAGAATGIRASLPVDWLASVWACGLAVVGGHLVVAVQAAQWPDAQVLALPAPGAEPVSLSVRARGDGDGDGWEVLGA